MSTTIFDTNKIARALGICAPAAFALKEVISVYDQSVTKAAGKAAFIALVFFFQNRLTHYLKKQGNRELSGSVTAMTMCCVKAFCTSAPSSKIPTLTLIGWVAVASSKQIAGKPFKATTKATFLGLCLGSIWSFLDPS